jgi:Flp pilus assembly protein TadD
MGKASKEKKKVGKLSESGRASLEGERIGLASNATSLSVIITAASVAIVTFMVFLPALHNEFTNWDDDVYIYENAFIRSIDANLFKLAFFGFNASNWHPLTWISHAVDYAIWGLQPLGHHLTNNILHALNTFMVVFLVIRLMGSFKKTVTDKRLSGSFSNNREMLITGALTGLLFGLHPLHVESVAWVSERKELLCALFFFLSITMYTNYVSVVNNETAWKDFSSRFFNKQYLFTLGFFILALLSKPMAVSLPVVLLILDWYPFSRIRSLKTFGTAFIEKIPFIALSLFSSILTILAQKTGEAMRSVEYAPMSTRVLVAAKSLIAYLWKMIFPLDLIPFYPYPTDMVRLSSGYLFPLVLVTGITAICVVIAKKQKLWLAAWGYYLITLLPVIGIVQVGEQAMADRYTYLPSLGPFLIMCLIAAKIYEKVTLLERRSPILKMASVVIAIAALISMSYITIQQIGVWKNSLTLWNYVIEKEPGSVPVAHNNLGNIYASEGQLDMAIEQYQTALRLKPNFAEAHNNLGNIYKSKGQLDMAVEQYQTALRLRSNFVEAHNNLGTVYKSKGQLDMAIEEYQTALRLKPNFVEAHNNLGNIYASEGQLDMAIEEYQTTLRLKPNLAEGHKNLGIAYIRKGLKNEAIREFNAALEINPSLKDVRDVLESLNK